MKKLLQLVVSILMPMLLLSNTHGWAQTSDQIKWQPERIDVTVIQGTSQLLTVQFTVPRRIEQASLFVVPEIAGVMQMSLLGQTVLNPGAPIQTITELSVPATTPPGTYTGTVHVRSGAKTVPATLKVQIQVVQGSSQLVVNQVADPSPDRVGRMGKGQFLIRDELVVVLRGDVADRNSRIKEVAGQVGAVIIGSVPGLPVYQLRIVGADIPTLPTYADAARRLAGVESVSLNLLGTGLKFPNDALFNTPDSLTNAAPWDKAVAAGPNRHLEFIHAPEAWDITTGLTTDNKKQFIAVIDDDFDFKHPDLIRNITKPHPETPFTLSQLSIADGHGTKVAGTICAEGNNEIGVVGVAWHCSLLLYASGGVALQSSGEVAGIIAGCVLFEKLVPSTKCFSLRSLTRTLDSMKQAVDDGAKVVNMSIGFVDQNCKAKNSCTEPPRLDLVRQANDVLKKGIEYSVDEGKQVLWVIAAGNEGRLAQAQSPASLKDHHPQFANRIIVVAAAQVNDKTFVDDRVDKSADSNHGSLIDVAAPAIVTTTLPGSSYALFGGTSAAAPQVSGLAVLVLSKYPNLSAAAVKSCIVNTTTAPVKLHAFKVINAKKAVECAIRLSDNFGKARFCSIDPYQGGGTVRQCFGLSVGLMPPFLGGGRISLATAFSVPTGADLYLQRIRVPVYLSHGTNSLHVVVRAEVGGLPGEVLKTFVFTNAMTNIDAFPLGGPTTFPTLEANFGLSPLRLNAGSRYWVEVLAPASDTEAMWSVNQLGEIAQVAFINRESGRVGLFDGTNLAMEIDATAVPP